MKKLICICLCVLLLCLMAGCNITATPPETTEDSSQTVSTTAPALEDPIGKEDTYWLVYEYYDEEAKENRSIEDAGWFMDLTVFADGTARYRDIFDDYCIMDDEALHMTWQRGEDGVLRFFNEAFIEPILEGTWEDGTLNLQYRGTPIYLKQAEMPETIGMLYSPAELTGTWIAISGMTEGYEFDLMPSTLQSIVVWNDASGERMRQSANMEWRDSEGYLENANFDLELTVLDQPLYTDCENAEWSVRLGPEQPHNELGSPIQTEYYVTLLSQDEMLLQNYYTLDGAPAVSYITFRRMPPALTWWDVEEADLENTVWRCDSYISADGTETDIPQQYQDLTLTLGELSAGEINGTSARWLVSDGGATMIWAEDFYDSGYWYGGAVRASYLPTSSSPFYEMYLYHDGGFLHLVIDSYG